MPLPGSLRAVLDSFLEALQNPAYIKDSQHRWVAVNDAYCVQAGQSREQLLGKRDADIYPAEFSAINEEEEKQILARKGLHRSERQILDASGALWEVWF